MGTVGILTIYVPILKALWPEIFLVCGNFKVWKLYFGNFLGIDATRYLKTNCLRKLWSQFTANNKIQLSGYSDKQLTASNEANQCLFLTDVIVSSKNKYSFELNSIMFEWKLYSTISAQNLIKLNYFIFKTQLNQIWTSWVQMNYCQMSNINIKLLEKLLLVSTI